MDTKTLQSFKEQLEEKKHRILDLVRRNEEYGREAIDSSETMDMLDQASSSYNKEFHFNKSNVDRTQLKMVAEALGRIESGEYGMCARCEEEISPRRLSAVPWARHCIKCQEKMESGG